MAKTDIINLLDKSNIAKDLKVAYSFMLLSRGYTADEIKILDDYVFMVRKKGFEKVTKVNDDKAENHIRRKQKSLPKSLICLTSTSDVYNRRDHTIYSLNGSEPVTKGRLVWSIIKLYQQEKNSTYEEVRQGLEHYIKYCISHNIQNEYIKHGSTWFNQRCWEDDYRENQNTPDWFEEQQEVQEATEEEQKELEEILKSL